MDGKSADDPRAVLDGLEVWATTKQALAYFDELPPVTVDGMTGSWRGAGLATDHPLGALLQRLGWHGKTFHREHRADPLVFGNERGSFPVNPALLPIGPATRCSGGLRNPWLRRTARTFLPLLGAPGPRGRLRITRYRGVESAALTYNGPMVQEYYRQVDENTRVGVTAMRGFDTPYLFALHREDTSA